MNGIDPMNVLALNSGSSSLKFGIFRVAASGVEMVLSGAADSIGAAEGRFSAKDRTGAVLVSETMSHPSQKNAVARVERLLATNTVPQPAAVGHRVVHGGPRLRRHCVIDDEVLLALDEARPFAPLHLPPALAAIRFAREHFPDLPHVACFDTVFHATMADVASALPIDRALRSQGIRRYGFHGLSCESIVRQLGDVPDRLIVAHLGNGASVTAIEHGRSIDTSMGMTPSGGVIMGTRSGDLDPGVLVYLMREKGYDAAMIEDLVDHRSGLFGISGLDGDMRPLHKAAASDPDARLALAMFCASVRKAIAAMITVLDGVDLIVFTGGIGENDAVVRASICDGLSWIGIGLDAARNRTGQGTISDGASRCVVEVLPSEEDEAIARHTRALVSGAARSITRSE